MYYRNAKPWNLQKDTMENIFNEDIKTLKETSCKQYKTADTREARP